MNGDCKLKTERMELREICVEDTKRIVAWRSDPQVYKFFRNPHALTEEEHLQWFRNKYKKDKDMVSWVGWFGKDAIGVFQAKKIDTDTAEVSYLLEEEYQGRGFAVEAVRAIEKWTAEYWNVKYSQAEIHIKNDKSREFILRRGYEKTSGNGSFDIYIKELN